MSSRPAFGWTNSLLHQFEIGAAQYGTPDPDLGTDDMLDESRAKSFRVVGEGTLRWLGTRGPQARCEQCAEISGR